jgi:hypothetical protein
MQSEKEEEFDRVSQRPQSKRYNQPVQKKDNEMKRSSQSFSISNSISTAAIKRPTGHSICE